MSEEERLKLENELLLTRSKAQMINMYLDALSVIKKARRYITENCILSDKWSDLGSCNFIPTGHITYKNLTPKKVKELLDIL